MRVPPLDSLRVFEAAGRTLSFTAAAEELNVTQAAVSHRIKALEESLGLKLFVRGNRTLALTETGRSYLPSVRKAMRMLAEATEALGPSEGGHLKVSTLSSFAIKWLIPRLPEFRALGTGAEPMISVSPDFARLGDGSFDVAVRCGRGHYPGCHAVKLMDDTAFPVCSGSLMGMRSPADLLGVPLLSDHELSERGDGPDWAEWLDRAGVDSGNAVYGASFNDTGMAIQAAAVGQGVALGRKSLVLDDINAGLLMNPLGPEIPTRFTWYAVCAEEDREKTAVDAFISWLARRAAEDFGPPSASLASVDPA